jgi:hypothetical protein
LTPLGSWQHKPHYPWLWYRDLSDGVWENSISQDTWQYYKVVLSTRRRSTKYSKRYRYGQPDVSLPEGIALYPVTVLPHSNGYFSVSSSESTLNEVREIVHMDLWRHADTPPELAGTPPFFQHLLSTLIPTEACQAIATELQEEKLVVCSDGSFDPQTSLSSHGVVYASNILQQTIATVSGPVDGHPSLLTSYRAELSGIVAVLYLTYRICQYYQVTSGAMTLYCDKKGALKMPSNRSNQALHPTSKQIMTS